MKRLTTNKNVSEMGMYELAMNSCYSKDGLARYRDFEKDVDARELTRELLKKYAEGDDAFEDVDAFDDEMLDLLQYGTDTIEGLIALFYLNLWTKADLRERLKAYEDAEEQGLLLRTQVAIGQTVFTNTTVQGWYMRKSKRPYEATVVYIGINGVDNYMNVDFKDGYMLSFPFSQIGKTVFLTREEAEKALADMGV